MEAYFDNSATTRVFDSVRDVEMCIRDRRWCGRLFQSDLFICSFWDIPFLLFQFKLSRVQLIVPSLFL